jgi:hypothetical protein
MGIVTSSPPQGGASTPSHHIPTPAPYLDAYWAVQAPSPTTSPLPPLLPEHPVLKNLPLRSPWGGYHDAVIIGSKGCGFRRRGPLD